MSDQKPCTSSSDSSSLDVSKLPRGAISIRGLPIGRNARLPSIRSPRDLTLIGTSKRTFVPNIPARREKKQSQNADQKPQKTESKSKSSPSSRGRGRGRGQREYVQMPGVVFGQGVTASPKPSYQVPSEVKSERLIIPKERLRPSLPNEFIVKKEAKSDSDSSAADDHGYEDEDSDYEPPVCLPLKTDPEAKSEPQKASKTGWNHEFFSQFSKIPKEEQPKTLQELLFNDTYEGQLIFFELPDTILLPLQNRELVEAQKKNTPGPSDEDSNGQDGVSDRPSWNKCIEGLVGKLQLLKSGRTRLVIGDFVLDDIEMADPSPVLQQLVSVHGTSNDLDMAIIGQLRHRVRLMPNVQKLAEMVVSS